MLKAVLFDLDDTLIDWSGLNEDWDSLQQSHLESVFEFICGYHRLENKRAFIDEYYSRMMGAWTSARDTLIAPRLGDILLESAHALGLPEGLITSDMCMEAYQWDVLPGARLFPEVVDVLTELHNSGLKLGIVTNAAQPMWARDVELDAFDLTRFFPDCRFSAADHGYLKPHPSIFKAAMNCLGVKPEETVFVGDNLEADVAGAKQAGIYAIWRRIQRRPTLLDGHIEPDSQIHSLVELYDIFDEQFPGWKR